MKPYKSAFHVTNDPDTADELMEKMDLNIDILQAVKYSDYKLDKSTYSDMYTFNHKGYSIDKLGKILLKLRVNHESF